MAADPKVDALLGRALRDKPFRDRLVANPADVAKEAGLSPEQLELVAGGLALGSSLRDPSQIMYCTEKTCNEKGGARVIIFSPDPAFNPLAVQPADAVKKTPGTGGRRLTSTVRTYEESCSLLDRIVGRCVRDARFAEAVLEDPERALEPYDLNKDEMDDFRALRNFHRDEASRGWAEIRAAMESLAQSLGSPDA